VLSCYLTCYLAQSCVILLTPSDSIPKEIEQLRDGIQGNFLDVPEEFRVVNLCAKDPFRPEDLFGAIFVFKLYHIFNSNPAISIFDAIQQGKSDAISAWKDKKNRPFYCEILEHAWKGA